MLSRAIKRALFNHPNMPVTRSASGRSTKTTPKPATSPAKRKVSESSASAAKKPRNTGIDAGAAVNRTGAIEPSTNHGGTVEASPSVLPAKLSFSFEEARRHLINADNRFQDLFNKMTCKPFEHLDQVHPFRALATSILGQQISWLAARSIIHKFRRLYDPSLPEHWRDYPHSRSPESFFPTPEQVAGADVALLRTAGLSARKAEYVKDLAARFADGRLSTQKLVQASDEELLELLTSVRGIGKWTVDMFAIFSLRRPDILPVGDLGVQRGLVRWFLSLHSPSYSFCISPEKIEAGVRDGEDDEDDDVLPALNKGKTFESTKPAPGKNRGVSLDISSVPPIGDASVDIPAMPEPFTPSINRTLKGQGLGGVKPPPLPEGLSAAVLKARLEGKKRIKGAYLTPQEMGDLTESWKPYRSVGVFYMWSLADPTASTKQRAK